MIKSSRKAGNFLPLRSGILLVLVSLSCPLVAEADQVQVPNCGAQDQISGIVSSGLSVRLSQLQGATLLANHASVFIESPELKIKATQDFIRPSAKIKCVSTSNPKVERSITIPVPSLLDFTSIQLVGSSVWQFNLNVGPKSVGVWDQFSRLFSREFQPKDLQSSSQQSVDFFQINQDQFELVIHRHLKWQEQAIVIDYDLDSQTTGANPP